MVGPPRTPAIHTIKEIQIQSKKYKYNQRYTNTIKEKSLYIYTKGDINTKKRYSKKYKHINKKKYMYAKEMQIQIQNNLS